MSTKAAWLAAYRARLEVYGWAREPEKLERFMASVRETITTDRATWNHSSSDMGREAWRDVGCKGKMTLKALRALPQGDE